MNRKIRIENIIVNTCKVKDAYAGKEEVDKLYDESVSFTIDFNTKELSRVFSAFKKAASPAKMKEEILNTATNIINDFIIDPEE